MSVPPPTRGGGPALHGPAPAEPFPADFLRAAEPGTRVVARHRVPGGFTDALGYLRWCDGTMCEIETRRGPVTVPLANVVAAKRVPEPPPRRAR
ncbi:ferrous iron transport protein A [Nakamurella sp.]|uniref:putative acetyltransferase n=1 Tax=Nakamurella sp. TaxID=1869182 RepID=UPI003784FDD9